MQHITLKVKDADITTTVNQFLKELLATKKVHALLVPQDVPSKKMVFPVLISDPEKLHANVFAPVLPSSTATMVKEITRQQPPTKPLGVVMHPCQIRALTELVKLNQANLDNIIIIGVDCLGTMPVNTYTNFPEKKKPADFILESYAKKTTDADKYLRTACKVCTEPVPVNADVVIGVYGMDIEKELLLEPHTDAGKKLLEDLKPEEEKEHKERDHAVKHLQDERKKQLTAFLKDKSGIKGIQAVAEFFDTCVNCHNCRQACPICYCHECLFDSDVFDAEGNKFIRKAETKGLFKMPNDSLLFHLGRMNHMILSCVKCGLCEQACPNTIPLMEVFIPTAENAQKEFDYHPGKDKNDKIPMIVYREDEYTDVGEA